MRTTDAGSIGAPWSLVVLSGCPIGYDSIGDGGGDGDGDGDGGDGDGDSPLPEAPDPPELTLSPVKQSEFSWAPADGAEFYRLLESAKPNAPYVEIGDDVVELTTSLTAPLPLDGNQADNSASNSGAVYVF